MSYIIRMPYYGFLSKNSSKNPGGRGFKLVVKDWMSELGHRVVILNVPKANSYYIIVNGFFTDNRYPDLANLHEVIGDGLKRGLKVDDKYYKFIDGNIILGNLEPYLLIEIIEEKEYNGKMGSCKP